MLAIVCGMLYTVFAETIENLSHGYAVPSELEPKRVREGLRASPQKPQVIIKKTMQEPPATSDFIVTLTSIEVSRDGGRLRDRTTKNPSTDSALFRICQRVCG